MGREVGAAQRDAIFGGDFNKVSQHDQSVFKDLKNRPLCTEGSGACLLDKQPLSSRDRVEWPGLREPADLEPPDGQAPATAIMMVSDQPMAAIGIDKKPSSHAF